ncbi:MAG: hypothetical protein K5912_03465 [Alphaproteobacteria bacterium]|nr:hypothetical protein [Alphaproteobacteria bacterium]
MKKYYLLFGLFFATITSWAKAATVVATVNGNPITDTDITARTQLMARQGKISTDNRRKALQNIIDDSVKLAYAANFNVNPTEKDAEAELKRMGLGKLSGSERTMAVSATRANMAWQIIVARTIMPTIKISDEDIRNEKILLEREHGLPIELTMVRLVDIPADIAKKLPKPKSCDNAIEIAENMGGAPQKITAKEYELAPEIRERVAGLPLLTWSSRIDNSVLLVCKTKKTKEYGKLDEIIKQNATYKQAMFVADQQLKQLRRKAVIVINDNRYKL